MSERRLREIVRHGPDCYVSMHSCCCGKEEALAADHDVVKAALQIRDGFLPMARGAYRTSELGSDKNFYDGEVNAYRTALTYLEDEFGFILTDKGWEWTEEATDE